MKLLTSLLIVLSLQSPLKAQARNNWDAASNFALGVLIGGSLNYGLGFLSNSKASNMWDAFALGTLINASKEFYFDKSPDSKDFTASEVGALVGISICVLAFE